MTRTADVVVVGGGVMGAATAMHLARRGVDRVWLLEKSHLAAGSSGKSGAILRQHYSHRETVRMAREGLLFYRDFQAQHGLDIGFAQHGMLFLVDPRDREPLERNVAMQVECSVPTRVLDSDGLATVEPRGFWPEDATGCYETDAGSVNPRRAVEAMVEVAESHGVVLSQGEAVHELLRDGDHVVGVKTSHGELHAAHTVLATGPWSVHLFAKFGFEAPISVVRPQQAYLEPPAKFGDAIPIFADLTLGAYWKPEGPHHTRVGSVSTADDNPVADPDHYDEGVDDDFVQHARHTVGQRLPGYQRSTAWGGCSALYTMTPDDHAILDQPVPGVTLATGFSGHGFKLAPAVGRGITEWILDGKPSAFPADFFALNRFTAGRTITSGYRYGLLG